MPTDGFSTVVHALLALWAGAGISAGWYFYARHPWERTNRESRVPVTAGTLALTRHGVSVGFLMFVPIAAGAWADYVGTIASLRAGAGVETAPPSFPERIAMALPGELVMVAGSVVAVVAFLVPLAFVFRDIATGVLGRRDA